MLQLTVPFLQNHRLCTRSIGVDPGCRLPVRPYLRDRHRVRGGNAGRYNGVLRLSLRRSAAGAGSPWLKRQVPAGFGKRRTQRRIGKCFPAATKSQTIPGFNSSPLCLLAMSSKEPAQWQ